MLDIVKGVFHILPTLKSAHDMRTFYKTLKGNIRNALSKGREAAFDEHVRVRADLLDMACEEDFVFGYQLCVQVMLAAFEKGETFPRNYS